jgi:hypothetical protein
MDEPAAAEPSAFFSAFADAPAAAPSAFFSVDASAFFSVDASAFFSVDAEDELLAAGALELPLADGVLVLDFSWLVEGAWPACDSCFFSCATAPNDSIAAATAIAMGLNLI